MGLKSPKRLNCNGPRLQAGRVMKSLWLSVSSIVELISLHDGLKFLRHMYLNSIFIPFEIFIDVFNFSTHSWPTVSKELWRRESGKTPLSSDELKSRLWPRFFFFARYPEDHREIKKELRNIGRMLVFKKCTKHLVLKDSTKGVLSWIELQKFHPKIYNLINLQSLSNLLAI